MSEWQPIETAPRDGRELLMTDGKTIHVCYPKRFPRSLVAYRDDYRMDGTVESKAGDVWEYFRDEEYAPGHTWSMVPTHFILLEDLPQVPHGA